MTSHLFIAEKPSVAATIANARASQLGVSARKGQGSYEVGDDRVTWLFGHLYEQAGPDHYDARYKNWHFQDLPIIPERWVILPKKDQTTHIGMIARMLQASRTIVNVGDSDREGQLLVDELLLENGVDPFGGNVLRLWLTDQTEAKIIASFGKMFPNADKRNLYNSAVARQRADWTIGMNGTRGYTIKAREGGGNSVISVGRVQTPTLRLVVDRDREIAKFVPVNHFLPTGLFVHQNGKFRAKWIIPADCEGLDSEGRLVDRAKADAVGRKIAGKQGRIELVETKKKSKSPPLPYDLAALQKECSSKFGLTADQTLQVAQALYETRKVASYPRSEIRYLPTGILTEEAPQIMKALSGVPGDLGKAASGANMAIKGPVWNDSKVKEHYGIIPTTGATASAIASLSDLERKVFELIAKRFAAQFYADQRWDATVINVSCENERFKANGKVITDAGWTVVYGAKDEEEEEDEDGDEQSLPKVARGDPVTAEKADVVSKTTTPPSKWTDGTLIEAMQQIHKFVKDSETKKKLKETSGIGTSATRANIIETLVRRTFLVRKGKFIVSTPLGQSVIDVVDDALTDPTTTALWEDRLKQVSEGEISLDRFMQAINGQIGSIIKMLETRDIKVAGGVTPLIGHGDPCPKCKVGKLVTLQIPSGKMKGKKVLVCDKRRKDDPASCDYIDWKDDVKKLPGDGNTCPSCKKGILVTRSWVPKGEKRAKSILVCNAYDKNDPASCRHIAGGGSNVPPMPGDGKPCPACGKGVLQTRQVTKDGPNKGKKFLVCSDNRKDDPKSCSHIDWGNPKPVAMQGDGQKCPACGKGTMRTRMTRDKRTFLSCDAWVKDDPKSCNHAIWPEKSGAPRTPGGARPTKLSGIRT